MKLLGIVVSCALICGCGSSPVRPTEVTTPPPVLPPPAEGNLTGPTITAISPSSAATGTSDLTITVTGTNFVNGDPITSWVRWSQNGKTKDLDTKFISDTELTAVVPGSLLGAPGTARLFVTNGDIISDHGYDSYPQSNSLEFVIMIPSPTIGAISPTGAVAGSADLIVRVTGTNFVDGFPEEITSWVRWSGNGKTKDLETRFVTDTELTALIPASLLSTPGTAHLPVENGDMISVSDGYDHYPQSNSVEFEITAPTTAVRRG